MAQTRVRWEQMDKSKLPLGDAVEHYLIACQTEAKSPKTLIGYREKLTRYVRQAGGTVGDFTIENVRAHVARLQATPRWDGQRGAANGLRLLSPETILDHVRILRGFATWLYEEGYTPENVLQRLQRPKTPSTLIEILDEDEIRRVLGAVDPNTTQGVRDLAILTLFLDAGLRLSELANFGAGRCPSGRPMAESDGEGLARADHSVRSPHSKGAHQVSGVLSMCRQRGTGSVAVSHGRRASDLCQRSEAHDSSRQRANGHSPAPSPSAPTHIRHPLSDGRRRCLHPADHPRPHHAGDDAPLRIAGKQPRKRPASAVFASGSPCRVDQGAAARRQGCHPVGSPQPAYRPSVVRSSCLRFSLRVATAR